MNSIHVLILAGGSGTRMNTDENKVFLSIAGKSVLRRSVEAFIPFAEDMIIVYRSGDFQKIEKTIKEISIPFPVRFVAGGATRQKSVAQGLSAIPGGSQDIVLIHDAARCLVDSFTIQRVIDSVLVNRSGVASVPVTDTIKICREDKSVIQTPERKTLLAAQTPQGFFVADIKRALTEAEKNNFIGTDDASLFEHCGMKVTMTEGNLHNIKITNPEDLIMAENILQTKARPSFRIGHGFDVHQLVSDRKLILCGVEIPWSRGLLGHSDADVALHALMDSLLGAAGFGDIGHHFPDSDQKYKGISSMHLLEKVTEMLLESHYRVGNVDLTIIAQQPKLAPYIPYMRENIARILQIPEENINVKATTTEHLGFEGRMEGISAQAVSLILSEEN